MSERGRRADVIYSTKIGYDIYDPAAQSTRRGQNELPQKFDRDYMRFALDRCLERLETDHIDILQLHNIKMEHVRDADLKDAEEDEPTPLDAADMGSIDLDRGSADALQHGAHS